MSRAEPSFKMTKYRIIVKLPDMTLNFSVNAYEVLDNTFYKFYDQKTNTYRILDSRICEIIEILEENHK